MQQNEAAYFFSTHFMWWAIQAFHRALEDMDIDDIQRRVEDFEEVSDDVGWWLLDEGGKAGVAFIEDGKRVSIWGTNGPKKEVIAGWARALETLSKSVPLDETARQYYLLYLACRWLSATLGEMDALIHRLDVPDLQSSYAAIQPRFIEVRQWLQRQQAEIAREHLPDDQRPALDRHLAAVDGELVARWRDTIRQYVHRYAE